MSDNCKWCGLRPATQKDHDTLPDGDDGNLCWRDWNSYAKCFQKEEVMKDAAPDMLEALENLENDDNSIPSHAWELCQKAIAKAKGGVK